jgi:hypothetical protein
LYQTPFKAYAFFLPSSYSTHGYEFFSLFSSSYYITHQLLIKLTHENYSSILPLARGRDLLGFLDGSRSPPPSTVPGLNGDAITNPDFVLWSRKDQLLFAWLLSTISEPVVSQVVHCTTSAEL